MNCEINENDCASNPCKHGECQDGINEYKCVCSPGYTGTCLLWAWVKSLIIINLVLVRVCYWTFQCDLHLNNSSTGDQCDVNINECNSNPCMSGGTCVDIVNGFQCLCPPGTYGLLCLSGTDHCASQPCVQGDCIEQQHGYSKPLIPGLQCQ